MMLFPSHSPGLPLTLAFALTITALLAACGGDSGNGTLRVVVDAEASITEGLAAGTGDEDILDGWSVTFDRYVVVFGDVRIARTDGSQAMTLDGTMAIDLVDAGSAGVELLVVDELASGTWGRFGFDTPPADASTTCHASIDAGECATMRDEGLSHWISGRITKTGGESCPPNAACRLAESIAFEFRVDVHARYDECESEGALEGGFALPSGGSVAVSTTIHGDHVFFNGFPEGVEIVMRRAQWLADADVNGDDAVDLDELMTLSGSSLVELFPSELYNLSGGPLTVTTAADWVSGQLATQGHLNGEGECIASLVSP